MMMVMGQICKITFIILLVLSIFGRPCVAEEDQPKPPALPLIWGERQYVNEISGAFRILSEIHLPESKATFLMEEWALGEKQKYRLDLIHKETGKRRTILVNGQLDERFHYEPFVCSSMVNLTGSLSQELSKLFPQSHKFVLAGLGSIWLRATRRLASIGDNEEVAKKRITFAPALKQQSNKSTSGRPRKTAHRILRGYDQYTIEGTSPDDDDFPFKIKFHFHESSVLGRGDIEPESVVAISLLEPRGWKKLVTARIIEIETSSNAVLTIRSQGDLFELPLGYGCTKATRGPANSTPANSYAPPEALFTDVAHELSLEASAVMPNQMEHDTDKWHVHSSSFRLLAGQLMGRQYLVINKQEFGKITSELSAKAPPAERAKYDPRVPALAPPPSLRLNKLKRIWDLGGPLKSTGNQDDEIYDILINSGDSKSIYYDIDQRSGKCLHDGEASDGKLSELASFEFLILAGEDNDHLQLAGLSFDIRTLMKLFYETSGYHLVREDLSWPNREEYVHERRDNLFQLRGPTTGEIVWEGPASIVRTSRILHADENSPATSTRPVSASDTKVNVAIYLYTKSYDQLIGQIKLSVLPGRLVDQAYLHAGLSIEPCLRAGSSPLIKQSSNSISFQIDYQYQLDTDHEAASELLSRDAHAEQIIYEKFLKNSIDLANKRLDVLQFDDLQVDINKRSVMISGKLYEWPHLFEFHRSEGQRLTKGWKTSNILSEFKQNEAKCAESCAYYHCQVFSYCSQARICDLFVMDDMGLSSGNDTLPKSVAFTDDQGCALFTRRADKHQSIKPIDYIHQVKRLILSESGDEPNPMAIQFELKNLNEQPKTVVIQLLPTWLETFDSIANPLGSNRATSTSIKLDYEILLVGKNFKSIDQVSEDFPIQEANHMTYQDCESLCEENDCRSFAYCQIDKTCLVSRLHRSESIEMNSQPATDSTCRIVALNYQSKFQLIGERRSQPKGVVRHLETKSSRDCAISCMEEENFRCRSYYFCSSRETLEANCFLRKMRGSQPFARIFRKNSNDNNSISTDVMSNNTSSLDTSNDLPDNKKSPSIICDLFMRSQLVDFDHFYGKKLSSKFANELILKKNTNAEMCAGACVDVDQTTCPAFYICQDGNKPTCAMLSRGLIETTPTTNETITGADLEEAPGCTTFILPKLGLLNTVMLDELSDEASTGDEMKKFSSWPVDLIAIIFGLAFGYAIAWLFALYKNRNQ